MGDSAEECENRASHMGSQPTCTVYESVPVTLVAVVNTSLVPARLQLQSREYDGIMGNHLELHACAEYKSLAACLSDAGLIMW